MTTKRFERRECDRCGVQVELLAGLSQDWQSVAFPNDSGGANRSVDYVACGPIPPYFDICPVCRADLIDWWQEAPRHTQRGG